MPKYIRKPVEVEAVQETRHSLLQGYGIILYPGDWVITHSDGDITVMSDEEFRQQYEPVMFDWDVLPTGKSFEDYCKENGIEMISLPEIK